MLGEKEEAETKQARLLSKSGDRFGVRSRLCNQNDKKQCSNRAVPTRETCSQRKHFPDSKMEVMSVLV